MNVDRVESFRTSLMNQKQRLLKQTQIQSTFDKNLIEKDLKKKEDDKSAKSIIFGALRKISGGSRKSSKEAKTAQEECTSNTISEPSVTPALPLTPELLTINNLPQTPPPSPAEEVRKRTPVPSDSPLLSKVRQDPILKRIRSFNKSLKKASSFRQAREKIKPSVDTPIPMIKKEVTFKVKKSTMGRTGWKIMPEDESLNLKINKEIMEQVLEKIRTMQYSGDVIPDKITISV